MDFACGGECRKSMMCVKCYTFARDVCVGIFHGRQEVPVSAVVLHRAHRTRLCLSPEF